MDRIFLGAPSGTVGPVDLDNVNSFGVQRLCDSCTVAGGAFHAGGEHLAKASRPSDRDVVAGRGGGKLGITEWLTGIGECGQVNGVEVGIDADDDSTWGCHDGGVLSVQLLRAVDDNPVGRADKTLKRELSQLPEK